MSTPITIKVDKIACTSRPFDMQCFRIMYDYMAAGQTQDALLAGIENLFPQADIADIDAASLIHAMNTLLRLFTNVKSYATKKPTLGSDSGHPIRRIYQNLLDRFLPDEIDRQDPVFFFQVLTEEYEDAVPVDSIPEDMRIFYGM